jgi:hypothetical protein
MRSAATWKLAFNYYCHSRGSGNPEERALNYLCNWIPASAGMTSEDAGMTSEDAGMTSEDVGMTLEDTEATSE